MMTKIHFFNPWFKPSYAGTVKKQILSGWIGPGSATCKFASKISDYTGAARCLLTTSGTIALTVAAKALCLKAGDEILVPAYGVVSTVNAFASMGLSPRLVDIDISTGCMSPEDLASSVGSKTRAVCFVNFSGYAGKSLAEIAKFCKERNLPLIEDAACAFGNSFEGRFAGTFATVGTYSFSVPKIISTGQGGAIVTDSEECYKEAMSFVDQGDTEWRRTNSIRKIGTNLRYNDILASFGLAQLKDIKKRLSLKREVYTMLKKGLDGKIYAIPGNNPPLHNIVFTNKPTELVENLRKCGIEARQQYKTISGHPAYADLANRDFPSANYWTEKAVYLPFGIAITKRNIKRIVKAVLDSGIAIEKIRKIY